MKVRAKWHENARNHALKTAFYYIMGIYRKTIQVVENFKMVTNVSYSILKGFLHFENYKSDVSVRLTLLKQSIIKL